MTRSKALAQNVAKGRKTVEANRKAKPAFPPETVNQTQFGKLMSLSLRRVTAMVKEGVLKTNAKGQLDPVASVAAYVKLRENLIQSHYQGTSQVDKLREVKQLEIERKIAREDRRMITLEEAMIAVDSISGSYLAMLSGLPARITRDLAERKRIEQIIDEQRQRLAERFAEDAHALRSGEQPDNSVSEDDARPVGNGQSGVSGDSGDTRAA